MKEREGWMTRWRKEEGVQGQKEVEERRGKGRRGIDDKMEGRS